MKKIFVIKNTSRECVALPQRFFIEQGVAFQEVDLQRGEPLPRVAECQGVVVLGGAASANDGTPTIVNELGFVKEILSARVPYLGVCLGLQLAVKAAGGKVVKSPWAEIGVRDSEDALFEIVLTSAGRQEPFLRGIPETFNTFFRHEEMVELTEHMELLGVGRWCTNQIVRVGEKAYGTQFHFEVTPEMFREWLKDPCFQSFDQKRLSADFASLYPGYVKNAEQWCANFLKLCER